MTGMLSTVPYGADQTLYLVMDAVGPKVSNCRIRSSARISIP